jgi:hypothetical protein
MAVVLGQGPRLKVPGMAGTSFRADLAALRWPRVRQDPTRHLGGAARAWRGPRPVAFDHPTARSAPEALLTERAGAKAAEAF